MKDMLFVSVGQCWVKYWKSNPESILLMEISQTEKDTIIWYHLYVESKKMIQMNLLQNRNRLTDFKNKLMITKRERKKEKN